MHLDLGNTRQKTKTLTSSGKYNFTLPFEIHCCTKFLSTTFMSLMNPKENVLIHNMPIHYYYWAAQTIWTDVQHPMGHAPQQHRNDRTDPMTPPPPNPNARRLGVLLRGLLRLAAAGLALLGRGLLLRRLALRTAALLASGTTNVQQTNGPLLTIAFQHYHISIYHWKQ